MAWTVVSSGTYTPAALSTNYTIATDTTNGSKGVKVDLSAMALLDIVTFTVYSTCITGGASVVFAQQTFANAQASPLWQFLFESDVEYHLVINQSAGTLRAFPYSMLSL